MSYPVDPELSKLSNEDLEALHRVSGGLSDFAFVLRKVVHTRWRARFKHPEWTLGHVRLVHPNDPDFATWERMCAYAHARDDERNGGRE